MIKFSKLSLALAAAVVATASHAAPVVVDDFSTAQAKIIDTTTGDGGVSSQVMGAGILGDYRDLFVEKIMGPVGRQVDGSVDAAGLAYNADSLVGGVGRIRWDGINSGAAVDTDGLGAIDFTGSGSAIRVKLSADATVPLSMTIWSPMASATKLFNLAAGTTFVDFLYADFVGVDFTKVGAIELQINDGTVLARDLSVTLVNSVPEPGTVALLGMALLGLGAARRRKN